MTPTFTQKTDALYVRVSTDAQRDRGESISNQKERLLVYTKDHQLNPKLYADPGFSAKDTNRPALKQLLEDIKAGRIRSVLVTKLDRISRSMKDLLDLLTLFEDHQVEFKSITQPFDTSTAMGRGFLRLMGEFAQLEREMTSERVGEDMRHRAKNGRWNGGVVPYGYMSQTQQTRLNIASGMSPEKAGAKAEKVCPDSKKLYVHPEEANLIRAIFDKYLETESLRAVTHWLNSKKIPSRYGATWAANSVSRVLHSPTYIGKLTYNKRVSSKTTGRLRNRPKEEWIIEDGNHSPIISKGKFERVQKVLEQQATEPRRKRSQYLFSGLLRCGVCGHSMHGYTYRKAGEKIYSYYKCFAKQQKGLSVCRSQSAPRGRMEKAVIDQILALYQGKEWLDMKRALDAYRKKFQAAIGPAKRKKESLEAKNGLIEKRKRVLLERLEDETISSAVYKTRLAELDEELECNRAELYRLESELNDSEINTISFDVVAETLKDFKRCWGELSFQGKKDLLNTLVSKITFTGREKPVHVELFFLGDLCSRTGRDSWKPPASPGPGR